MISPAFSTPVALPSSTRKLPSSACRRVPSAVLQEPAPPVAVPITPPLWTPSSWRTKRALQQPVYPDLEALQRVERQLHNQPSLVASGEMQALEQQLAAACTGDAFVLQGGDCAESFDESAHGLKSTLAALFKMAVVLMWGGKKHVVKIGRLAGQYGKPRSNDFETRDGVSLPSYRGEVRQSSPSCMRCPASP